MGELMTWLESKLTTLPTLEYKGKKITKYLDDEEAREQLFEDGLVFRTDYPVDEKTITDKLKKATTITDVMRRRQAEEARAKGVKARVARSVCSSDRRARTRSAIPRESGASSSSRDVSVAKQWRPPAAGDSAQPPPPRAPPPPSPALAESTTTTSRCASSCAARVSTSRSSG